MKRHELRSRWVKMLSRCEDKENIREDLINFLIKNSVECRPIVTGNFAKNDVVAKYYDFEIYDKLDNANLLDSNGFFIGNHHFYMKKYIDYLDNLLENYFKGE